MSRFYSIDDHGVVTFCRPTDEGERGVLATLKSRVADLNGRRGPAGEAPASAAPSSNTTQA